jgi:hypothetical protein
MIEGTEIRSDLSRAIDDACDADAVDAIPRLRSLIAEAHRLTPSGDERDRVAAAIVVRALNEKASNERRPALRALVDEGPAALEASRDAERRSIEELRRDAARLAAVLRFLRARQRCADGLVTIWTRT